MSTRTDLLRAAERSAAAAIVEDAGWQVRDRELRNAKNALEAAALAQDIGPGEIEAALGEIQEELEAAGLLSESLGLEPADFLRFTLTTLGKWQQEVKTVRQVVRGFVSMQRLLQQLERDFLAGDTETSRRIAARIRTTLEDVDQTINTKTEGE